MQPRRTNRLALLSGETYDNPSFEESLRHITETGLYIIHVAGDDRALGWSYSTGMYDTWGQPEIIMTGFPPRLAGSILNDVADLYKNGKSIVPDQRIPGLIGNDIDVIFRPVADVWVRRLMLRTLWFYGEDATFPVLQCICPDFENRFPWDPGFDERWRTRQALLQRGLEKTEAETALWNVLRLGDKQLSGCRRACYSLAQYAVMLAVCRVPLRCSLLPACSGEALHHAGLANPSAGRRQLR